MEYLRFIFDTVITILKKDFTIFEFNISFFDLIVYSILGFLILAMIFRAIK